MKIDLLNTVRNQKPMIVNIANSVTQSDVANAISAIGGSPVMTDYEAELKTIVQMSDGVCVNIGTLNEGQNILSEELVQLADEFNKPVVLDPVGIGAISERLNYVEELFSIAKPTIIRGNASEIASLVGASWSAKGIDSLDANQHQSIDEIAKACSAKFSCVTVVTGPTDTIANSIGVSHVFNGNPMFTTRVGTGDMLSALIATFAGVSEGDYFEAAKVASLVFSLAGEIVMSHSDHVGPSEFSAKLIDELYFITQDEIEMWGKFDE